MFPPFVLFLHLFSLPHEMTVRLQEAEMMLSTGGYAAGRGICEWLSLCLGFRLSLVCYILTLISPVFLSFFPFVSLEEHRHTNWRNAELKTFKSPG